MKASRELFPSVLPVLCSGLMLTGTAGLTGCGAVPVVPCVGGLQVTPPVAVADHAAASPDNQVRFGQSSYSSQGSCPTSAIAFLGPIATSDPVNVSVTADGIAICIGTTPVPAIISPVTTFAGPVRTASLTCR